MSQFKNRFANHMNLATFDSMLQYCTLYGEAYQPKDPDISLEALKKLKDEMEKINLQIKNKMAAASHARQERLKLSIVVRKKYKELSTVIETEEGKREERDAPRHNPLLQELQNIRLPGLESRKERHLQLKKDPLQLQMHIYQAQTQWLDNLVKQMSNGQQIPTFENGPQLTELESLKKEMDDKNEAFRTETRTLATLQDKKENLLYKDDKGIIATAKKVKQYFQENFSPHTTEYREINDLKFNFLK